VGTCVCTASYGESALHDVLPVDPRRISADGPRAFSTDNFKPRLTPAGAAHPVTSAEPGPRKANEMRWGRTAVPARDSIAWRGCSRAAHGALLVHSQPDAGDGKPAPVLAVNNVGKGRTLALLD